MANKFKLWVENNVEDSTQDYYTFNNDSQRQAGFQSGEPASSIRVNSALRQANLVACALMDVVAPNDQTTDLQSDRGDVADLIKSKFELVVKEKVCNSMTDLYNTLDSVTAQTILGVTFNFDNDLFYDYVVVELLTAGPTFGTEYNNKYSYKFNKNHNYYFKANSNKSFGNSEVNISLGDSTGAIYDYGKYLTINYKSMDSGDMTSPYKITIQSGVSSYSERTVDGFPYNRKGDFNITGTFTIKYLGEDLV